MATISLDSQTWPRPARAADENPDRSFSVVDHAREPSVFSPQTTQQGTHSPHCDAAGASRDEAILISSDSESDWGDLDDCESDASFPPIEELLATPRQKGMVACASAFTEAEQLSAGLSAGSDNRNRELSATGTSHLADAPVLSPLPQSYSWQHPPAPPPAPALASRVSTLAPLLQAGWDQLSPAAAALCVTRKASSADKMPRAPTPGAEPDHLPSLARRPSPCPSGPREATPTAFPPCCDSAGQGPSDGDGEPSQAEPESSALLYHLLPRVSKVRSMGAEADGIMAVQAPSETSDQGRPRCSPRRRRRVGAAAGKANEAQQPHKNNARRQDDYDDPSPPRKRRKISLLGSAATRLAQPGGSSSRPRRAPTSGPAQSRSGRRRAGPSSSLQGPGAEREMPPSPTARFEEWALPDTVLKRVVIKDRVTFQLQFTWDSCINHKQEDPTSLRPLEESSTTRRRSTRPGDLPRLAFTPQEDALLRALKRRALPWREIHKQFAAALPQHHRSLRALQGRYSKIPRQAADPGSRDETPGRWPAVGGASGSQKRRVAGTPRGPAVESKADYVVNGQGFWNVDCLQGRRRRWEARAGRWVVEYLVRWENHGAESDTWEPREALRQDVPAMVQAFEKKQLC